jgi:superfamily II DNA or RNA helicase
VSIDLWPHQKEAIASVLRAREEEKSRGLWVMPTGTGKTLAFATLAAQLGVPTLVVVHRDELLRQTVATFAGVWPEAGVATLPGEGWEESPVVVATVQTLSRWLEQLPPERFGLVVVDEAHHSPARCWQRVLGHFRPDFLLGCTATPERLDGQSVDETLGETLYTYGLNEAMEAGYLVPVRQHGIRTEVSLAEVSTSAGDFSKKKLSVAVLTEARTRTAVEAYLKYAPDRPALVFAVDLEHVEMLRQAFVAAGIKAAAITGKTSKKERRRILEEFRDGHYQVLVDCEVLTEGYDERRISCVLMARPTQSKALYQQCVGRGLRIDPAGKADCLVLDLVDYGCRHRVMVAADLFGGRVTDCEGRDVREAVREEKARWKREPVAPRPSLRAR